MTERLTHTHTHTHTVVGGEAVLSVFSASPRLHASPTAGVSEAVFMQAAHVLQGYRMLLSI